MEELPSARVEPHGFQAGVAGWIDRLLGLCGSRDRFGTHDVLSPHSGHTYAPSATRNATTRTPVMQDAGSRGHVRSSSADRGRLSSSPACCVWVGALQRIVGGPSAAVPVSDTAQLAAIPLRWIENPPTTVPGREASAVIR